MRKLLFTSAAFAVISVSALAADLPARQAPPAYIAPLPIFSWTGFYAGLNGGGAFEGSSTASYTELNFGVSDYDNAFPGSRLGGGFGGAQIGYNWQTPASNFVFGIEADAQGAGISGGSSGTDYGTITVNTHNRIDFFGTVRGRVGYAFNRFLVYATGGFAYGNVRTSQAVAFDFGYTSYASRSSMKTGYAVGGGLEYAITPSWTLKVEYQYIDLGHSTVSATELDYGGAPDPEYTSVGRVSEHFHTVRAGLNYKFDLWSPVAPVVAKY